MKGVLRFFTNLDKSPMERLQRELESARFVKAFNSVANNCMVNPHLPGAGRAIEPLCMLWCIPGFLRNEWVHALKLK
ncbi:MAG: hypothetical protein ACHBNF_19155 [Chromatiales bacterium]